MQHELLENTLFAETRLWPEDFHRSCHHFAMQVPAVKNRAPAPIQISAEQLLREASERKLEEAPKAPKQYIADRDELTSYQMGKRKTFEDQLRTNKHAGGLWCRYAAWEASQNEFDRARSIFERALEIDYKDEGIWLKYGEMEMKGKFINHARNVWDRAVTLLPRSEQFWYKYTYMEELVEAIDLARNIFERWMQWDPDDNAWNTYVKFEERQGALDRARKVFDRSVECLRSPKCFLKYAKWEERHNQLSLAREVYERSLRELNPKVHTLDSIFTAFARFEERCKEFERVRVIFNFAIKEGGLEGQRLEAMKQGLLNFEKRHGDKDSIEDAVTVKRRAAYEAVLARSPHDYDSWFDYARLEEDYVATHGRTTENIDRVREVYERAVSNVPLVNEKRYWCRYIYLWIYYAVFEQLSLGDEARNSDGGVDRARAVYKAVLDLIPHHLFSFTKLWEQAAMLEVRAGDVQAARKILGMAIGKSGGTKASIYKRYLLLESQLGEIDRCRKIHAKWLENMPDSADAWTRFADFEKRLGETVRARAIFEMAVGQEGLDKPSAVWKAYIDLEMEERESANVRALYERVLELQSHVKVWASYALFEASKEGKADGEGADLEKSRRVFERAYDCLKADGLKVERVQLLNTWRDVEADAGPSGNVGPVNARMPRKVKKRRVATDDAGNNLGWEEYYDYEFPDDEKKAAGMKLMENALKWKAALAAKNAERDKEEGEGLNDSSMQTADAHEIDLEGVLARLDDEEGSTNEKGEEIDIDDI